MADGQKNRLYATLLLTAVANTLHCTDVVRIFIAAFGVYAVSGRYFLLWIIHTGNTGIVLLADITLLRHTCLLRIKFAICRHTLFTYDIGFRLPTLFCQRRQLERPTLLMMQQYW